MLLIGQQCTYDPEGWKGPTCVIPDAILPNRFPCRHTGRMVRDMAAIIAELDAKAEELRARLAELTAPVDADVAIGFGKRIGDGTTQAIQQMGDASIAQNASIILTEVERAREKVSQGTWGRCDVCGRAISEGRLEFRPWSTTCVDHAD